MDASKGTKIQMKEGGDMMVVGDGGSIEIEAGGRITTGSDTAIAPFKTDYVAGDVDTAAKIAAELNTIGTKLNSVLGSSSLEVLGVTLIP